MNLVASGTGLSATTVSYKDKSWRSACWAVINSTTSAVTLTFKDSAGNNQSTVKIPGLNTSYVYIYIDAQQMDVAGANCEYMIFV